MGEIAKIKICITDLDLRRPLFFINGLSHCQTILSFGMTPTFPKKKKKKKKEKKRNKKSKKEVSYQKKDGQLRSLGTFSRNAAQMWLH